VSEEGTLDHVRPTARALLVFVGIGFASPGLLAEPGISPLAPTATPLFAAEKDAEPELLPLVAATPLRLSLVFDAFPQARSFPECASLEEPSGNTLNGFPIQRYTFLPVAPRLTLHGFSSAGCPVDAGIGGGLTYAMPLVKDTWLVPSTGFYSLPRRGITNVTARIDIIESSSDGRSLNVGLGIKYGTSDLRNALAFGGSF
jgi:hypothetical protein